LTGTTRRVDVGTGEVLGQFSSSELPDRVLLKACGHRRATRCPSCSVTYQGDAYQLVAAGLRGGKGIPETVADHPRVFVTFTAPSFGAVHIAAPPDTTATCHLGTGSCIHRRSRSCPIVHPSDDPLVGQALCVDCFDYEAAVLWNACAGELWRRTTTAVQRALATLVGIPRNKLRDQVRLSFAKVVEYQRRGSIHIHAVIRLDAAGPEAAPPEPAFDTALLMAAVTRAAHTVSVPCPPTLSKTSPFRWGAQLDVRPIGDGNTVPKGVAGYLAKYTTKSTDPAGLLDRQLNRDDLDRLDQHLSPHLAHMVRAAWDLGGRPELAHLRLRAWAHTLGYRGHWLTKSRRYSTTFAMLRAARYHWNLAHDRNPSPTTAEAIGEWHYNGRGWTNDGDTWLAQTAAKQATAARRAARLDLASGTSQGHDRS
jgi:hypothetical protein